jgi:hypothetical protein
MARSPPGFMERFQGLSRSMRDRGDDSSSSERPGVVGWLVT